MRYINRLLTFSYLILIFSFFSCTSSRNIIASGKVTPKGAWKVGFNSSFNIASESISQLDDVAEAAIDVISDRAKNNNPVYYSDSVKVLTRALMAYSLDPVAPNFDFYVRYGVAERVDIGYRYASGASVFDAMYQFMGSTGTPNNPGPAGIYGSIGLQYSGQKSNLPKKLGFNKLSPLLTYEASRKDILIPLVFSKSFGPEEQYGNISWGLVYGHSFIKYGFRPGNLYERIGGNSRKINDFMDKENYSSYGGFVNAKIGFKYAYFLPSLNFYYQNYGTYNFFNLQQESYKGFTIIPSLGLQVNLGYGKAGRR
ncbi:hypothetical protein [Adhaeribacter aquaticus]|uniref:hypothetical protein n=1 Tax=Adhaeribacter aquaticus TaxID=299567 RepID=UPI0003F83452|nr:hypothetical protein [Adhaeribacter aquaticus]